MILKNNAKMAQEILNNLDDCEYSLTDEEKSEIKKELDAFAMNFVEFGLIGKNEKIFNSIDSMCNVLFGCNNSFCGYT